MKTKNVSFLVWMVVVSLPFLFVVPPIKADGTWSPVANNFPGTFYSMAYGNGTYVATRVQVQNNTPSAGNYRFTGSIYTSPDLATWTKRGSDIIFAGSGSYGTYGFGVFLFPAGMNQFVAYPYCGDSSGNNATSKILASSNGTAWSEKYSGNDAYVSVTNSVGTFYATHMTRSFDVGSNTTTIDYKILTSTDLDTWTDRYTGTYSGPGSSFGTINFSVGRYDQGYIAGLTIQNTSTSPSTIVSKVLLSTDGITWMEKYTGNGAITFAALRDTLAIGLVIPPATFKILTTTDWGDTWTERYNLPYTGVAIHGLAANNNDAFVGWLGVNNTSSGQFTMKMLYSPDGVTWATPYDQTFTGSGTFSSLGVGYLSPYFGTRFTVTSAGIPTVRLLLSQAGSAWTESYSNSFTGSPSFSLGYRNGNFLAWGYDGTNPVILKYSGPVTTSVAGTVKDTNQNPIAGATVSVLGQPLINTTTSSDGRFTLTGIPSGIPYVLQITKDGYWPRYHDSPPYNLPGVPDYTVGTRYTAALTLNTNAQVAGWGVAPNKGSVNCRAVDGNTSTATGQIKGVALQATGLPSGKTYTASYYDAPYAFTGSSTYPNGSAFFLNVEAGDTLTINGSAAGWTFPAQTFSAFAGGITSCIFQGLPIGATYLISGVTRAASDNSPLQGANLNITDVNTGTEVARPTTTEGGYYLARLLSAARYTITASRPGYEVEAYPSIVTLSDPSPNTTVNIAMSVAQTPLYAEFTGDGLYTLNGISWPLLTKAHPTTMAVAGSTLFAYFAGDGFYQWGGNGWTLITKDQPSAVLASSSALYADFPAWGLYTWNGAVWIKLTNAHPQDMVATSSTLFAYFTGDGLYSRTGSGWTLLTKVRPQSMVASGPTLYAYFTGDGLYSWNGTWTLITKDQPSTMLASSSTLYADFPGWGLYSWDGTAWAPRLTSSHPTRMAAYGSYLYADFAGDGLYLWNGTAWTILTKDHPTNMLASGSSLYADFAGDGFYVSNGTAWTRLTTSHPAAMLVDPGN